MAGRFSVEAVFKAVDRITAPVSRMQNKVGKFTRSMERGLRSANRQVNRIVKGMGRGFAKVAKFGAGLAAVGGAAVVTALNRTADAADSLAKQSRRLQFPIEELQEWKFVAEQSGVPTELLDKSLGAFSKRLGEAKGGMGPLVSGLKNINPQLLRQLQNTESVSDAFALYVNAMREADTATEKAALANAAFSRSGLNLVNIADNSAEAIAGLRNEQRENGNITMAQAVAAEAYNDAVNSLKRSLMGLLQGVILPMMPAITKTLRQWREWAVANKELIQTRIIEFAKNLKARVLGIVDAVVEFSKKYDMGERISDTLDTLGSFARFLGENAGTILKVVGAVVALSAVLNTLVGVMTAVNLVMALNPVGLIVLGIAALIGVIAAAVVWWDEIKAAMVSAGRAVLDTVVGAFTWLKDTFLDLPAAAQGLLMIVTGPIGALAGAAALITDNWEPIKGFFSDLWGNVTGIFEGALSTITGVADKVKNVAGGIVDKISSIGGGVASFFGFGDDEEEQTAARGGPGAPQVVTPQERVARSVEEQRSTSTAELTIRDESGRAEVTRNFAGPGVTLVPSGGF